ncbi:uncharacterized protein FIBRA_06587 [Fibroporia radiculosa]|uniref:Uncharacterized protein n=1 Tax=Fibroporia radiculosa TaxID=599839 RepID=J4GT09_9APHY|nr:uncharacterized protein FIBRA_06587 [Fibroporia radiculosa]CCM04410.1 predicted protein [Fibroporia radiculosa]
MEKMIRLYPDFDANKTQSSSSLVDKHYQEDNLSRIIDVCSGVGVHGVQLTETCSTDTGVQKIFPSDQMPHMRSLLKSVRDVLGRVYLRIKSDAERLQQLKDEVNRSKANCRYLQCGIKHELRKRGEERKRSKSKREHVRSEWAGRLSELRDKLDAVERDYSSARKESEILALSVRNVERDMMMWRKTASKYKKKYHAQKTMAMVAPPDEKSEDSLEIVC